MLARVCIVHVAGCCRNIQAMAGCAPDLVAVLPSSSTCPVPPALGAAIGTIRHALLLLRQC